MNNKLLVVGIAILGVILLAALLGYFWRTPKGDSTLTPPPAGTGSRISLALDRPPLSFDLPQGYAAFQSEGFEGGYGSLISIGRQTKPNYLSQVPLFIRIDPGGWDPQTNKVYKPADYIPFLAQQQRQDPNANVQQATLFGNPAIRYANAADNSPVIVGYIRKAQHGLAYDDLLVTISGQAYGSGQEPDLTLFEMVVSSIKLK